MIGYVTLGTNDLSKAAAFYDAVFEELGAKRQWASERGIAWGTAMDKPILSVLTPFDGQPATVGNGVMVGLAASSQSVVARVHERALALGGKDEGAVGPRGDNWYCGYFRDLDGNKLVVFCIG